MIRPFVTPHTERFWRHVQKTDACWNWTAMLSHNGYGKFNKDAGVVVRSHRYSWEFHNGTIPSGMLVLHRCDNRRCVNPEHLFLGTARDNTHDMIAKGRARLRPQRGEEHGQAKLTAVAVREIRERYAAGGISHEKLGVEYGVSGAKVGQVVRRTSWSHIQ